MIIMLEEYPGYGVTDKGDVISYKYGYPRVIKQYSKTYGYLYLALSKNGKKYHKRVHRLVAQAFIPNPNNLPEVNHINEDKTDNRVENLEWCTAQYNKCYGSRLEKVCKTKNDPDKLWKNNKSGCKGVCRSRWGTWIVTFNRKYLGTFKTFDEAVKVRKKAEHDYYDQKGYTR